MRIVPLFPGFPGRSDRGFLGWSSCVLLLDERPGGRPWLFDTLGYNERYELLAAIERHGVTPDDVAGLFLSHFHFDHAVNYRLFPNAELLLHERELSYARAEHQRDLAIPIEMLADLEATGRLRLLSGDSGEEAGVRWFLAPGHTAGLYALALEQDGESVVLASDAVKNLGELLAGEAAMAWSKEASRSSIASILATADVIVPGHDRTIRVTRDDATATAKGGTPQHSDGALDVAAEHRQDLYRVGDRLLRPDGYAEVRVSLAREMPGQTREWLLRVDRPA